MWAEEVTGDSTRRIGYERYWSMHTVSFCSWIIECQRAVPRSISADSKLDLPHLRVNRILDLKNLTLAGQDAIAFLDRCEANGITLKNCTA
jgi:hypothetical protein